MRKFSALGLAASAMLLPAVAWAQEVVPEAEDALNSGDNAWVLISGEVPLSMARSGLISERIGRLSQHGIAWQPVIAASVCASALILSNLSRGTSGLYDFMMRLTSSTNLILYIGVCIVALRFGINKWLTGAALLFSLGTLWGSGLEVALWSGLLLLTALPLHLLNLRQRKGSAVG